MLTISLHLESKICLVARMESNERRPFTNRRQPLPHDAISMQAETDHSPPADPVPDASRSDRSAGAAP